MRVKRVLVIFVVIAIAGFGAFWMLTRPSPLPADQFADLVGDPSNGEQVFWAAGCAACHSDPKAEGEERLILSGGYRMVGPFGTFVAPNISPGPEGIAEWSAHDLANALIAGVSPQGRHLYPALPYTTYSRMRPQDVVDVMSYLNTLPVSDVPSQPHELSFPFTVRRGLGIWKRLNLRSDWVMADVNTPELERGRYLVEALGHCAECHTPRNAIGALDTSSWLQGAPNPSGKGMIPGISAKQLDWSAQDIAYYLETGFTPDFDSAGGQMAKVILATGKLSPTDREAIAAYLKVPIASD